MKTRIIISLIALMSLELSGQSSDIKVIQNQKIIGENLLTQQDILAKEYQFPNHIYKRYLDSATGNITLQLRKLSKNGKVLSLQGQIIVFNLRSSGIKWSKKIDYSINDVNQIGSLIRLSRNNKIQYINNETGIELWNDKNDVYYINEENNIGVQYIKNEKNKIQGVDLNNGNVLWQRDLSREYGWNKIIRMNDSTLLIAAAGLHSLNIKNGMGWDYNTVTGKKDYTETIAKNAAGVVVGFMTGVVVTSSGPNLVRDVASNVLLDSNFVYFASKEKLSKINKNSGEVSWTYPLDEKTTSKSSIFLKDGMIYLVNRGYANFGNKQINFGDPFILVLNTETGKKEYSKSIGTDDNFIMDYKVIDDNLFLVLKDKILKLSLSNMNEFEEKPIDLTDLGELNIFVRSRIIFKKEDSVLSNLVLSDTTKHFVQTTKSIILELDDQFKVGHHYNISDLYFYYNDFKDYKLYSKGFREETIISDKDNHIIARIKVPNYLYIFEDKLYSIDGESLIEIAINDLGIL